MSTPHDQGRPDTVGPGPTPPAPVPSAGAAPGATPGTTPGAAPGADPGPAGTPGTRPAPQYGQYAPAGWSQPGTPAAPVPPAPPTAPGGWGGTPAVPVPPAYGYQGTPYPQPSYQPGIVPLRPLSIWEIFDGAFRAIRANPKTMFGLTAAVVTVAVVISSLITWYVSGLVSPAVDSFLTSLDPALSSTSADGQLLNDSLSSVVGTLLSYPLLALATVVLTGLLILSVSRSVIGQTVSVREVLHGSGRRLLWIVGFSLLSFVAVAAVCGALVALVMLISKSSGSAGLIALVTLASSAVLVVLAFWFTIRTLLVPPALMLEGGRFWPSVARAWRLTRGSFWRLLGLYLLVQILGSIVSSVVTVPASLITTLVLGDSSGTSGPATVLNAVASIIALTLTTVFTASVIALAYIDVRMRREGLDVELARAAGGAEL